MLNGLLAPPLIVIILIVCNNRRALGDHVNGRWLNVLGVAAALVMTVAAIATSPVSLCWGRISFPRDKR